MASASDAPLLRPDARSRDRPRRLARETTWGLAFLAPWIVGFFLFTAMPMLASLVLSLTDFDPVHPEALRFVGLDNYRQMLVDPLVGDAIGVTVRFALMSVPFTLVAALGVAVLVNHRLLAGRRVFRTLFYMPIQIPLVASTLVWAGVLNAQTGWLNYGIESVGLPAPDWLLSTTWVLPGLTLMGVWGIGNMMLIFLAGLQSVPTELYEAARVDGAGAWTTFRRITLPMISPVLFYNLVISLINTFQYFTQAFVLTNGQGDPDNASLFFNLNLYREAFGFNHIGYGSALAWVLFLVVLGLTIVLFGTARRWVYYAAGDR